MSDSEIVITFQSERDLWYVQLGEATAVVSAEDMVHEYYRWRRVGAPGVWRDNAREFCHRRVAATNYRTPRHTRNTAAPLRDAP
jgi:hypothetical protein